MSGTEVDASKDARQRVAAEVLELGQALFDALIETAADRQPDNSEPTPFPVDEVRAAADEFFTALRLLLGMDQEDA